MSKIQTYKKFILSNFLLGKLNFKQSHELYTKCQEFEEDAITIPLSKAKEHVLFYELQSMFKDIDVEVAEEFDKECRGKDFGGRMR